MTIIQFEKLKKDFQKAEQTSNDTNFLAAREKNSLIRFIYEEPLIEGALRMPVYNYPSVFDPSRLAAATRFPFREAFDHLILKGNSFDNTEFNWSNYEATINEARELYKYYKYIESYLNKEKNITSKKLNILSHKQKLLVLHYLGLDTSKIENSKTAKILSQVLELSEDNTRQYLSYITGGKNNVRTKKNLEKVQKIFESQQLEDISNKIKSDLDKL